MKEIIFVDDFGAKGDGITDNTKAVNAAIAAAKDKNEPCELRFSPNCSYYFAPSGDEALKITDIDGLAVTGCNTTILCDGCRPYMYINKTENVHISGFNFDMKTRAHFVGTVVSVDKENLSAVFKADRKFEMEESVDINGDWVFGLHETGNVLSRIFYFLHRYEWVDKEKGLIRIFFGPDTLGTEWNVKNRLEPGVKLILPTPHIGHMGIRSFTFVENKDLTFESCRIWNAPYFVFGIWWQSGTLLFKNVRIEPPIDEKVDFVSWRDCFHCKSNPGRIVWDSCTVRGNNDDIINLSANMMYVSKFYSSTEIECYWRETNGGSYGDGGKYSTLAGQDVVIWNVETGKLVARTKIAKVVDSDSNRYILEDPISDMTTGEQVRICIESHVGPGSEIIDCDFKGTLRLKCNHTVRNSRLYLLKMWIDYECYLEGPLAKNMLFENTDFFTNSEDEEVYYINCYNDSEPMRKDGTYHIENVVFKNCRGLHKGNFFYKDNFVKGSANEIMIIE